MAHWRKVLPAACALVLACAGVTALTLRSRATREASATLYAMSTVVTSRAWGAHAQEAVDAVTQALAEHEARLSLYEPDSDIARLNAAAGTILTVVTTGSLPGYGHLHQAWLWNCRNRCRLRHLCSS